MPNYSSTVGFSSQDRTEADAIERQRRLADALTSKSMQPVQSAHPSAPLSWTQGLAQMLQAYAGKKQGREADTRAQTLGQGQEERRAADTALLAQALQGRQAQPAGLTEDPAGNVTQTPAMPAQSSVQSLGQAVPMLSAGMQPMGLQAMMGAQQREDTQAHQRQLRADAVAARVPPESDLARYQRERGALPPGDPRIKDYDLKLSKLTTHAPAPSATATVSGFGKEDDKYLVKRREQQAEAFQGLEKAAKSAYDRQQSLDRFLASSKTGMQGGAAPLVAATKNFLSTFGYPVGDLKDTRIMEQTIGEILGTKMQELGARGLTDRDMDILRQALPRVDVDAGSREAVARILKKSDDATLREYTNARDEEARIYPEFSKKTPVPQWLRDYKNRKPLKRAPGAPPPDMDAAVWGAMTPEEQALF